nr:synapse differentiation-inducing gene protein 1-like [Misgurnus anguillicaudatus]
MSANGDVQTFYSSTPTAYNSLYQALPDPHQGVYLYAEKQEKSLESKMEVQLLNKPSDGDKETNPDHQVVTMQPEVNVIDTPQDKPLPDYLGYSIFTMIFCFLPTGIAALVYSITTRNANKLGQRQIAEKNSRTARILNHVTLGIGLAIYISSLIAFGTIFLLLAYHH